MEQDFVTTINCTKDYDKFSFYEFNRLICNVNLRKIINSMKKESKLHLKPIVVSTDFKIFEGQHRFLAAKKLNLEIYYVIDEKNDALSMCDLNNCKRSWKLEDYLRFWEKQGNENYKKLKVFCTKHKIRVSTALCWVFESETKVVVLFKKGEFKFDFTFNDECIFLIAIQYIDFLSTYSHRTKRISSHKNFHRALKNFLKSEFVNGDVFLDKVERYKFELPYCLNELDYTKQFIEIYNHKRLSKLVAERSRTNSIKISII